MCAFACVACCVFFRRTAVGLCQNCKFECLHPHCYFTAHRGALSIPHLSSHAGSPRSNASIGGAKGLSLPQASESPRLGGVISPQDSNTILKAAISGSRRATGNQAAAISASLEGDCGSEWEFLPVWDERMLSTATARLFTLELFFKAVGTAIPCSNITLATFTYHPSGMPWEPKLDWKAVKHYKPEQLLSWAFDFTAYGKEELVSGGDRCCLSIILWGLR